MFHAFTAEKEIAHAALGPTAQRFIRIFRIEDCGQQGDAEFDFEYMRHGGLRS